MPEAPEEKTPTFLRGYPQPSFPTIFADTVSSLAIGAGVVKIFLARIEPSLSGGGDSEISPITQVVMTNSGFAAAVVFFNKQLQAMIDTKKISQEEVDSIKAHFINAAK